MAQNGPFFLFLVVVLRKVHALCYSIDFAIVAVEFVEVDGLRVVGVHQLKNSLDFFQSEGGVQPRQDF